MYRFLQHSSKGAVLAGDILRGAMALGMMEKGGLGALPPANFFPTRPFLPKKTPYFSTEIGHLYMRSCKNERAKIKESRQNDRNKEYRTIA